ncbi:SAM-dependent methyltransferase [Motiliproteus coralliicola]|nr:cyclopropane-fatty-acyl-phospholipid synthase family protein [Motiliproteus coralliicola]
METLRSKQSATVLLRRENSSTPQQMRNPNQRPQSTQISSLNRPAQAWVPGPQGGSTIRQDPINQNDLRRSESWIWRLLLPRLERRLQQAQISRIEILLPGGSRLHLGQLRAEQPVPLVELKHPQALVRGWFGGLMGWAEGYMAGDWSCRRLLRLTDWAMANEQALEQAFGGTGLAAALHRLVHRLRPNSLRGSRRNIASHYDLGNEFYRRWLDPSMTYSAALFDQPGLSLEQAQHAKNAKVIEWLEPGPGDRVLEIGCGWGGLAQQLSDNAIDGINYLGVTLSEEQLAWCRQRPIAHQQNVAFELCDYRHLQQRYDRIVSIEMLEAVGEANWPTYFNQLKQRLSDDGCAVIQVITIADQRFASYRRGADFIQRYIFPGGMLPSPCVFAQQVERAGLQIDRQLSFGPDYGSTLNIWADHFERAWPELQRLGFDQRFYRMWRYYLAYCESGFKSGSIDVQLYRLRHAN